jgi:hypothetical protein
MLAIRFEQLRKAADDLVVLGIGASILELNTQSSGTSKL